jgi:hypothetical protein
MIAVAVVALVCAATVVLMKRRERFLRTAQEHTRAFLAIEWGDVIKAPASERERLGIWNAHVAEWRVEMTRKYRRAARYPWLPVAPDPPMPRF